MHLETGTILADKYRLESVLGVGGMGTVYRAQHLALNAPVAVKVIDREVTEGDVALSRFMREAQSAASLRSPHVVQILDYGTDHDRPFMVMELLEGEPLGTRIRRLGRLPPEDTFWVMHHIAKAVSKAHEAEIVHRDLKPDNVFLVHNEGDEIAKVLDFGVAKVEATALDGAGHTRTGSLLGTPFYMSPEQAQGNKDVDSRSDLWALGVIAFECMTGRRPFQSDGLGDLVLQICIRDIPVPSRQAPVPHGFDAWFEKACAREPSDRFQTARELAEALRQALGLAGTGSIPESRWAERSRAPRLSPAAQAVRDEAEARKIPSTTEDAAEAPPPKLERGSGVESGPFQAPVPGELDERATDVTVFDDAAPRNDSRISQWEVVPRDAPADRGDPGAIAEGQPAMARKVSGTSLFVVGLSALLIGGALVFGLRTLGLDLSQEEQPAAVARPRSPEPSSVPATSSSPPPTAPAPPPASDPTPSDDTGATETEKREAAEPGAEELSAAEETPAPSPEGNEAPTANQEPKPDEKGGSTREDESSLDAIEGSAQKAVDRTQEAPPKKEEGGGPSPVVPETLAPPPPPPPPAQN